MVDERLIQEVYDIYDNTRYIEYPPICGTLKNVFVVHTLADRFVVKFNHTDLVAKNQKASQILFEHNIPAPLIRTGCIKDAHYETYRLIPGYTLHQAIIRGMSRMQIRQVYKDIVTYFCEMDAIPVDALNDVKCANAYQVAQYNIRDTNGGAKAHFFSQMVRMLNLGHSRNIGVYHFDISPKNVLVSDKGQFIAFLDLDGVALCNRNFAFGTMAARYKQLGLDPEYLYNINDSISTHKINRSQVNLILHTNNIMKKLLWHCRKTKEK